MPVGLKAFTRLRWAPLTNPLILFCILGSLFNKAAQTYPIIIRITWINNTFNNIELASLALSLIGVEAEPRFDKRKAARGSGLFLYQTDPLARGCHRNPKSFAFQSHSRRGVCDLRGLPLLLQTPLR